MPENVKPVVSPSRWRRLMRHRWNEDAALALLPAKVLAAFEASVQRSEHFHSGEIRLVVEGGLPWSYLWRRASPRERAVALFGKLGVWDTAQNNGVLIYLLMADRAIEIVADRGLSERVDPLEWCAIVDALSPALRAGRFAEGLAQAVEAVDALLQAHYPIDPRDDPAGNPNELPNRPLLL